MGELVSYSLILLDVIVGVVSCMCLTRMSLWLLTACVSSHSLSRAQWVCLQRYNEERISCAYSNSTQGCSILLYTLMSISHDTLLS